MFLIYRDVLDSWNGTPTFLVAAKSRESAMEWIQDEVDGKHSNSGHRYMQGKSAEYWTTTYPLFRLVESELV